MGWHMGGHIYTHVGRNTHIYKKVMKIWTHQSHLPERLPKTKNGKSLPQDALKSLASRESSKKEDGDFGSAVQFVPSEESYDTDNYIDILCPTLQAKMEGKNRCITSHTGLQLWSWCYNDMVHISSIIR